MVELFLSSSQNGKCNLIWEHKKKKNSYIVCDMRLKNKAYELNLLIIFELQIELQLQKKFPHALCFFSLCKSYN
jgi:hypothetical protein